MTFLGWLSDLQLGDEKVTKNHLDFNVLQQRESLAPLAVVSRKSLLNRLDDEEMTPAFQRSLETHQMKPPQFQSNFSRTVDADVLQLQKSATGDLTKRGVLQENHL